MKEERVVYEIDLDNLPALTVGQKAELKALAVMSESEIDSSEIPPLREEFWKKAVQNPICRSTKT
jgi:hypothetical protein